MGAPNTQVSVDDAADGTVAQADGAATGEIGESMEPWAFSWWFTEASSHT